MHSRILQIHNLLRRQILLLNIYFGIQLNQYLLSLVMTVPVRDLVFDLDESYKLRNDINSWSHISVWNREESVSDDQFSHNSYNRW